MPACTGDPPGLLIFTITPILSWASNADFNAALMSAALAGVLLAISPSILTTAVCLPSTVLDFDLNGLKME